MKKIIIIGSGFSGLSAACYLGKSGYEVTVLEKNEMIGGRARQLNVDGFTFDMGPTFYWMPDIFDSFFSDFNKKTSDYYKLVRLEPGYEVYFGKNDSLSISADLKKIYQLFEQEEKGSSKFLKQYLKAAHFNYNIAINKVVYKPGKNIFELIMPATAARLFQFLQSISSKIRRGVKSERLRQILEFPVLFLGAKPSKTPAFYCFMNHADMVLGTWHIQGGMFELVKALQQLAQSYNVTIKTNSPVEKIITDNGLAKGVLSDGVFYPADLIISSADYQHSEQLLDSEHRNYKQEYWKRRVFAPSALMFYVALDKKLENVSHHTLFFDSNFELHASQIYDKAKWPDNPLFYASFPSITDVTLAPKGKETAIFLIPIAPGLKDTEEIRKQYFDVIIERLEQLTDQSVKDSIIFCKSFTTSDFVRDYNAYKGNAYGLSNILLQTAFLKPKMQNKKIKNLFYTGQLTVPGPGVPPAIISGKIVSTLANSYIKKTSNGKTI